MSVFDRNFLLGILFGTAMAFPFVFSHNEKEESIVTEQVAAQSVVVVQREFRETKKSTETIRRERRKVAPETKVVDDSNVPRGTSEGMALVLDEEILEISRNVETESSDRKMFHVEHSAEFLKSETERKSSLPNWRAEVGVDFDSHGGKNISVGLSRRITILDVGLRLSAPLQKEKGSGFNAGAFVGVSF